MHRKKDVVGEAERVYPLRYTPRLRRPRNLVRRAETSRDFSGGVSKKKGADDPRPVKIRVGLLGSPPDPVGDFDNTRSPLQTPQL